MRHSGSRARDDQRAWIRPRITKARGGRRRLRSYLPLLARSDSAELRAGAKAARLGANLLIPMLSLNQLEMPTSPGRSLLDIAAAVGLAWLEGDLACRQSPQPRLSRSRYTLSPLRKAHGASLNAWSTTLQLGHVQCQRSTMKSSGLLRRTSFSLNRKAESRLQTSQKPRNGSGRCTRRRTLASNRFGLWNSSARRQ